jgi:hypothetical protein
MRVVHSSLGKEQPSWIRPKVRGQISSPYDRSSQSFRVLLHALSVLPSRLASGVTCRVDNGPKEGTAPPRATFQAGGANRGKGTPTVRKPADIETPRRQGAEVPGREIQERILPRTTDTGTGRTGGAAYRYRGAPKPDPATARAQQALATLAQLRMTIALRSSRVRALTAELVTTLPRHCVTA